MGTDRKPLRFAVRGENALRESGVRICQEAPTRRNLQKECARRGLQAKLRKPEHVRRDPQGEDLVKRSLGRNQRREACKVNAARPGGWGPRGDINKEKPVRRALKGATR